jgi:putative ABC transport system substrate-binding protein
MERSIWNRVGAYLNDNCDLPLAVRLAVTVAFVVTAPLAQAEQPKQMPRIGWLSAATSANEFPEKQALEALREMGWVDGKNIVIEFRHTAGNSERLSQVAAELVQNNVEAIVTFSAGVAVASAPATASRSFLPRVRIPSELDSSRVLRDPGEI